MFVDASAIVAILTREPDADALADILETARSPITLPIAIFEAALGICRKGHASVEEAERHRRARMSSATGTDGFGRYSRCRTLARFASGGGDTFGGEMGCAGGFG